ncbi:TPA: hypothetical protein DEO28_01265 [Candidatus Dependentiae bacterium]|nr:MAG: hypothetical protein UR14_C0003G0103 [candidate division TM6 bacterium GW2011_GWE2_31_21]KKP53733.1 MAG: hypothetical protein UR43_C0003G0054 [candidate division TM6 bacterium GW2011_GWF2_33_332]HBS48513.1 hypothetical protein [Candidatus Dependentiae bacterium]HBZ73128.1 hypothetical protein [Candidatus Dependentiae bacterium]
MKKLIFLLFYLFFVVLSNNSIFPKAKIVKSTENKTNTSYSIESNQDFYDSIKYDLVAVYIYDGSTKNKDLLAQQDESFKMAAAKEPLVLFTKVNIEKKDLKSVIDNLGIKGYPAIALFSSGKMVALARDIRPEQMTSENIRTFILDSFGQSIIEKMKYISQTQQQAQEQQVEVESESSDSEPRVGIYFGVGSYPGWYGYPYGYYPYGSYWYGDSHRHHRDRGHSRGSHSGRHRR